MKRVLERLMDTVVTVDDDDDVEEGEAKQTNNQQHSSVHCSLSTLCDWYSSQTKVRLQSMACVHDLHLAAPQGSDDLHHTRFLELQKSSSGTTGKKRSSPGRDCPQQPPVVIIFKDLEAFSPKVLQDFILICRYTSSQLMRDFRDTCLSLMAHVWLKVENVCSLLYSRYIERLPLMFIFGIATSPSTIQHMLPHSVSSLLCIELFQSLTCTQHLATVIDKVISQS